MITCGLYTALITPFDPSGNLDEEGFRANVRFQKQEGVDGLVVLGATGEIPTLTQKEKNSLLKIAREEAGHLSVVAGALSASTAEMVEIVKSLQDFDVDAVLIAPPYYNKPTQEGIFRHFEAICSQTDLPIILYNHKGRTNVNVETATLLRMLHFPNLIGVKEASGNLDQIGDVLNEAKKQRPNFLVFSGDDPLTFPMMSMGADGVLSVVSNLIPSSMLSLVRSLQEKNMERAREWHFRLLPLFKAIFLETNPIPIKAAMQLCGFPSGEPRLPLTPLDQRYVPLLEKVLEELNVLKCV